MMSDRAMLKDRVFMAMTQAFSVLGTCARRRTACILVDGKGHIIGEGYNGPASKEPHCIDHPCLGAGSESGKDLDKCDAIHAEANALIKCTNPNEIVTAYCTTSPCIHCVKLLMNTGCKRIIFNHKYSSLHDVSEELWRRHGGIWQQL